MLIMIYEKDEVHLVAVVLDHVKTLKSAKDILGGGVLVQLNSNETTAFFIWSFYSVLVSKNFEAK